MAAEQQHTRAPLRQRHTGASLTGSVSSLVCTKDKLTVPVLCCVHLATTEYNTTCVHLGVGNSKQARMQAS